MATGNLTADGNGDWVELREGTGTLLISGTWGSGTAVLQVQLEDGSTGLSITSASWTDDATYAIDLGAPGFVRVSLSGSTSPDLDWEIRESNLKLRHNR